MADGSDAPTDRDRGPDPDPDPDSESASDPAAVHPWTATAERTDADGDGGPDPDPGLGPEPESEPGPRRGSRAERDSHPDVAPGTGVGRPRPGDAPADPADPADPDVPAPIRYLGRGGEYLAGISVLLALGGVTAISLGIQPYGNVVTVTSIAGVSVAMVAGMAFQAYVSDAVLPR